jgi:hypothetical protein
VAKTLDQMEQELNQLKEQVKAGMRAQDELEISKVQSLYSHYYHVGMRSEIPALFAQHTPGVNMEIEDSGVYDNLPSITRFWNTVFSRETHFTPGFMAVHMTCNPVVEINEEGSFAKALWHSHGYCALRVGKLLPFICLGKYDMEYVKEDGHWKIFKFAYRQTFMSPMEKGFIEAPSVGSIAANPANHPDKPTTYHMPYNSNRVHFPQPPPPEPVKK